MPEFVHKPLPYLERVQKAQRILRSAQFRTDQRLAVRELCEAVSELAIALVEREQGVDPPPAAGNSDTTPPKKS